VRWKLFAIVAFLAIAGGAVGVSLGVFTPTAASSTDLLTATAQVADVTDEVAATGTVASVESYATAFGTDPWVVGDTADSADSTTPAESDVAWNVTAIEVGVGDAVKAGDVLARADSSDLDAQIDDARRSVESARLSVVEAKNDLAADDSSAQVRQARIALYSARSAKANADATLKALIKQRENGDDSNALQNQIEDARRSVQSARLQVIQAQADLQDALTGDPKFQARIALNSARSAKANADATLAALIDQRNRDTIVAPIDGIVTDVALVEGGDAPSGAAITIESGSLVVSTSVVESDVASISVGQAATVTISALDEVVEGTVASIAPSAEEASTSGVVSFAVTVELSEVPAALRPGMTAEVTIVVASAQDVLTVPSRALSGSGDSYTVRVVAADGTVEVRAVTVGLVTDSLAEIQSGLSAGDAVVTGSSSTDALGGGGGAFPGGGPGGAFQVDGGPGGFTGPGQ
jgi:RND family efflux transporter MFP subunit